MEPGFTFELTIQNESYTAQEVHRLSTELISQIDKKGIGVSRNQLKNESLPSKGSPIDMNTLLVTLASAGAFNILIQAIKEWSLRGEQRRVRIAYESKGKKIEIDYSPSSVSEKELLEFINKINNMK